jgi:S1-C subfamily serine protease
VALALIAAPETVPRNLTQLAGANPFAGATVANLSPALAEELSLDEVSGVVVVETEAYSTARRIGLRPGDVIVRLNDADVASVTQFVDLLKRPGRGWDLTIRRGGDDLRTILRS